MAISCFDECMDFIKLNNALGDDGFLAVCKTDEKDVLFIGGEQAEYYKEAFRIRVAGYYPEILRFLDNFTYAIGDMSNSFISWFDYFSKQDSAYYKRVQGAKTRWEEDRIMEEREVDFKNCIAQMSETLKQNNNTISDIRERMPEETYVLLLEYYSLLGGNFREYINFKTYAEILDHMPLMKGLGNQVMEIKNNIIGIEQYKLSEPVDIEKEFAQRETILREIYSIAGCPIVSYEMKDIGGGRKALCVQNGTNFTADQMTEKLTGGADPTGGDK